MFFFLCYSKCLAVDAESALSAVTNFMISILNGFY